MTLKSMRQNMFNAAAVLCFVVGTAFSTAIFGQDRSQEIVTNNLRIKDCKTKGNPDKDRIISFSCAAGGGLKLETYAGLRNDVSIVFPGGTRKYIDFQGFFPSAYEGITGEIKFFTRKNGSDFPFAGAFSYSYYPEITKFNLDDGPPGMPKGEPKNAMVFLRISAKKTCITQILAASPLDREFPQIAPDAASRECITPSGAYRDLNYLVFPSEKADLKPLRFVASRKELIGTGNDGSIRVWNTETGKETSRFYTPASSSFAISADGRYLAIPKFFSVELRKVSTGELVYVFEFPWFFLTSAISPNGKFLAVSGAGLVKVWEISSRREIAIIKVFNAGKYLHGGDAIKMAFSPDGTKLLTDVDEGEIKIWDSKTGKSLKSFKPFEQDPTRFSFSPDGKKILVIGTEKRVLTREEYSKRFEDAKEPLPLPSNVIDPDYGMNTNSNINANYEPPDEWSNVSANSNVIDKPKMDDDSKSDKDFKDKKITVNETVAYVFDVSSGKKLRTINFKQLKYDTLFFTSDGSLKGIQSSFRTDYLSDYGLERSLLDINTGKLVGLTLPQDKAVFSDDGNMVARILDGNIWIYDIKNQKHISILENKR